MHSQTERRACSQEVSVFSNLYFIFFLQSFIGTDITFAVRPYFRGPFCSDDIRESLVVNHIKHVLNSAQVSFLKLDVCTGFKAITREN